MQTTADSLQLFCIPGGSLALFNLSLKLQCTTTCYNLVTNLNTDHETLFNDKLDFHAATGSGASGFLHAV